MSNHPMGRSKYKALYDQLMALPPHVKKWWLTFDQIETLLGRKLPPIAYTVQYWANDRSHRHTYAWLLAGWKTTSPSANVRRKRMEWVRD